MFTFTDCLQHLAATRTEQAVKEVWTTCLQGTALSWHSAELSDLERRGLALGTLDEACGVLQNRFKCNLSDALRSLESRRFTLWDLHKGKSIRPFVQHVIWDAKACELPARNQLSHAFEALDGHIQSELTKHSEATTLKTFLE